jgi:hypothetical protein
MKRWIGWLTVLALALFAGTALAQDNAAAGGGAGLVTGLLHIHAFVRWISVAVAAALLVKLGMGLVQGGPYDALASRLMTVFSRVLGVQWLIGIIFALALYVIPIGLGNTPRHVWEHLIVMTVVVGLSEMHRRFKNAPDGIRYRNTLLLVIVCLVLVFIGVQLLPQGWRLFPVTA